MADVYTSEKVPNTSNAYNPSKTNPYLNTHRASGMPHIGADTGSMPITSTNVSIWCNGQRIGAIQKFDVSESRQNKKLQELGTEGVIQIVPGNTKGGQLKVTRIALYNSSLFNALGLTRTGSFVQYNGVMDRDVEGDAGGGWDGFTTGDDTYHRPLMTTFSNPFKTLKDQRVPLEVMTKTQMDGTQNAWYVETYIDCWLTSYGKSYSSSEITVSEDCGMVYSDVITTYTNESND